MRLTYDVKKEFDKAKGDLTSNHFLKTLLELYNKEFQPHEFWIQFQKIFFLG